MIDDAKTLLITIDNIKTEQETSHDPSIDWAHKQKMIYMVLNGGGEQPNYLNNTVIYVQTLNYFTIPIKSPKKQLLIISSRTGSRGRTGTRSTIHLQEYHDCDIQHYQALSLGKCFLLYHESRSN